VGVKHDEVATLPRVVHVEHATLEVIENRFAVCGGRDEDGRLFVDQALPEKAGNGGVQRFLVIVKLNGVMLMSFGHDTWARLYARPRLHGKYTTALDRRTGAFDLLVRMPCIR
jgi:hypothetical protein